MQGKQLVNSVSVSEDLTFSQQVFRVKKRFLLQVKQPRLIKDNAHHHTLPNYCVAQWSKVLYVYLPLCAPVNREIFITPGMNITSRDTCVCKLLSKC